MTDCCSFSLLLTLSSLREQGLFLDFLLSLFPGAELDFIIHFSLWQAVEMKVFVYFILISDLNLLL